MKLTLTAEIELNDDLLTAFRLHLVECRAGSVQDDWAWYDAQLQRLENDDVAPAVLAEFLLTNAGRFESVVGTTFADWTAAD